MTAGPDGATPRAGAAAAKVLFEYAYRSARLTRRRVAVCAFLHGGLPLYLDGVKLIRGRASGGTAVDLEDQTRDEVSAWLGTLPRLAVNMPATLVMHRRQPHPTGPVPDIVEHDVVEVWQQLSNKIML